MVIARKKRGRTRTPLRYPGSKDKLWPEIRKRLPDHLLGELFAHRFSCYCEPFFGSGAIGFRLMGLMAGNADLVLINDLDLGISNLWTAVKEDIDRLLDMVGKFKPSPEQFDRFKQEDDRRDLDPTRHGFQKLAMHRTGWGGLGKMAGSSLGGHRQKSIYTVDCRWKPNIIARNLFDCHELFATLGSRLKILNEDFQPILEMIPPGGFAYLDPPYYVKGAELYKHSMTDADHERLAAALRSAGSRFKWVLSYDDHEIIRSLYSWAIITSFEMTPTVAIAKCKRRKNSELIIRNFH